MSDSLIGEISTATEYLTRAQDALLDARAAETQDSLYVSLVNLSGFTDTVRAAAERAMELVHQYQPDKSEG